MIPSMPQVADCSIVMPQGPALSILGAAADGMIMATHEDYLAQEYLHLQKVVEDFDTKTLTIKAWSVTFSTAAVGFAYGRNEPAILVAVAAAALAFWLVECLLKVNQQAHYARIDSIEEHFAGRGREHAFQIGKAWEREFAQSGGYKKVFKVMWWPHVLLPHVAIAGAAIALWLSMQVQDWNPRAANRPAVQRAAAEEGAATRG